jgi:hypothetical protein
MNYVLENGVFMYIHIGQDFILNDKDVMGVFDFDNISTSSITMEFLKRLEKEHSLISISEEIPKSLVLTLSGGIEIGYLSPLNSRTIIGRAPQ